MMIERQLTCWQKVAVTSLLGTFAGCVIVAVYLTAVNLSATDGPYFPPSLVAPFIVLPVTVVLLPFQVFAALRYNTAHQMPWSMVLLLGVSGGVLSAALLTQVLVVSSEARSLGTISGAATYGVIQGCLTLACSRAVVNRR